MLNDTPRQQLSALISRFGRSVCADSRRCEAMLKDLCPEFKRETHLLVAAVKERVVADLLLVSDTLPIELQIQQLAQRLHDNLGIAENFALWTVESWALALDIIHQPSQVSILAPPPQLQTTQVNSQKTHSFNQLSSSFSKLLNLLPKRKSPPVYIAPIKPIHYPAVFFQDKFKNGKTAMPMVRISGGTFLMGSPVHENGRYSIERQHEVVVQDFILGQYAVTFAQYDQFVKATGWRKPNDNQWGRELRPVIDVSWHDALAYAAWLSEQTGHCYRLPTEAEWEYACRAGAKTAFSSGDFINTEQANFNGSLDYGDVAEPGQYRKQTVEVGSFPANHYGLYDMHGNVWEWTASVYSENYNGEELSGAQMSQDSYRMLRGGSWVNTKRSLRCASRIRRDANDRADFIGFRLARDDV